MIEAQGLVAWYAAAGDTTYYPVGETVPAHEAMGGDWAGVVHRTDKRGRRRVVRMVYEVVAFQVLRDQLKCRETWVVGADEWRTWVYVNTLMLQDVFGEPEWAVLRPELRFQPRDPSRLKRHPQSAVGAYGDAVRLGRR
ncbi:hypothetical protein [Streptomyces sp. bgisy029]|uniref:hypothetical protein n=1 Tax=Streptomyces sp. bgisy029 TaxID=3413771 RepID=UPI003D74AFAF